MGHSDPRKMNESLAYIAIKIPLKIISLYFIAPIYDLLVAECLTHLTIQIFYYFVFHWVQNRLRVGFVDTKSSGSRYKVQN